MHLRLRCRPPLEGSINRPVRLARWLAGRPGEGAAIPYPKALAYWPAVAGFAGFAWFQKTRKGFADVL